MVEVFILFIFMYPGAGVRWLISRLWHSKKTFKEFTEDDSYLNGTTGLLFLTTIVITVIHILS